jgi:dTDP-4-amino-4,6-dideoxygalactose transaminase
LSQIEALRVPMPSADVGHAFYRFYAFVRPEKLKGGWNRDRILAAINAEGVPCFAGSCSEIYLEKAFADVRPPVRFPVARELGDTSLAFLTHPTLTDENIETVCQAVEKVMLAASLSS